MYQFVANDANYSDLWKVMKLIFIVTHGQSFYEQGFSINKLMSDVNMEEELLIVQRVIYDAMDSDNADAGSFPITKEMRQLQESLPETETSSKKLTYLQKLEKEQKRKLEEEEVKEMKRQKLDVRIDN